jgi:hypothetical protein
MQRFADLPDPQASEQAQLCSVQANKAQAKCEAKIGIKAKEEPNANQ